MSKLIDNFGRKHTYLRISVTDRCNLRCVYCMPLEGIQFQNKKNILTYEEIERIAAVFVKLGITKIRITGGEPLVRKNLEWLIASLHRLDGVESLALTTNGTLLAAKAQNLRAAGVSALNISLDTFKKDRFKEIARRDDLADVLRGIEKALEIGFPSVKLNMVVMSGWNDDEVLDFVEFAYDKPVNVRFIEYMPFKENGWQPEKVVTFKELRARIETRFELEAIEAEPSAVAKDFALRGGTGSVSFITSMSESFCSTCNRLRLTADGSIKSCLFYPAEINLRHALRQGASDQDIEDMIMYSLSMKPEAHPPAEEIAANENRSMIEIGG